LRFKTGDRVQMMWKRSKGFPKMRPVSGVVVAVGFNRGQKARMQVCLETGDHVIQDIEYDRDAWVAFKHIQGR